MAQTLSELLVRLGVDAGSFYSELDKAQRRQKNWADSWKAIGRDIAAASAGYSLAFGALVKSQINALDELDEQAQKTGASVQALSELNYAAQLEGVEDFTGALVKLNKSVVESDKASSQQARAFEALGVSTVDAAGNLRSTDEILMDVAEAFAQSEDGAAKSTIAMALFGKTGADLIPFLNNGRAGLAGLREEAVRFGHSVSTDAAAAAGQFNDNLFRLFSLVRGGANDIAEGLTPTLADLSTIMVENSARSEGFAVALQQVDTGLKLVLISGMAVGKVVQGIGTGLGATAAAIAAINQDREWYEYIVPPLAISKTLENFGQAATIMGGAVDDAQGSTTDLLESIQKVWEAGTRAQEDAQKRQQSGGGRKLNMLSEDPELLAARAYTEWKKVAEGELKALIEREETARQLEESYQSEELRARAEYVRQRVQIEQSTDEGTEQRHALMLEAERRYSAELLNIQQQRDRAEQDAELKRLQTQELRRKEADRALRNSPLAGLGGIESLEEYDRALKPGLNALSEFASVANSAFGGATRSAAQLAAQLIVTGDAGSMSGKQIAQAFAVDLVSGLIEAGATMAAQFVIAKGLEAAGYASSVTLAGTAASTATALWTPAAIAASIATLGGASSIGTASYLASLGTAQAASMAAGAFGGGRELGGGTFPGMTYDVTEQDKPEVYRRRADGRMFLMPGASGGDVMPMEQASGSAGSLPARIVINNYAGVQVQARQMSDGEIQVMVGQAVQAGAALAEQRIAKGVRSGRSPVAGAIGEKFRVQQSQVK